MCSQFMRQMIPLPNWMDVVGNTMELLCTILRETLAILISSQMVKKVLADSIFQHVIQSLNCVWLPEDGGVIYLLPIYY